MKNNVTVSNEKLPQVQDFHLLVADYCLGIFECNQTGRDFPQDSSGCK